MTRQVRIAFFGSSLVSAYWNGAATYYRGLLRALAGRGHRITFFEPDALDRQKHRDMDDPPWAEVVLYQPTETEVWRMLARASDYDLVIKASGVGVHDELLEVGVLEARRRHSLVAFWDVNAPATLDRVKQDPNDPFRQLIPRYDLVFTYGGGPPVIQAYQRLGARHCVPIYNAADPDTHHGAAADARFRGDLAFLGNRLPDRERRVEEFFLYPATKLPDHRFVLGGSGWHDKSLPDNVDYVGHVYTRDHNAFNASSLAVLNISRDSMASYGFSPATRVFEACAAGACLLTDSFEGIEQFFAPGAELLTADSGDQVVDILLGLDPARAAQIGKRARARVLSEHTYEHRAVDVERALAALPRPRHSRSRPGSGMKIVVLGLSVTSSWGNGHATTYRSLLKAMAARGHSILFLERDVPWYRDHRDLPAGGSFEVALYRDLPELRRSHAAAVRDADVVIVGSYVPDGIAVSEWVLSTAQGLRAFYDIDTPVTLAALDSGDCAYLTSKLAGEFDLYLSFAGGDSLERVARDHGATCARPLYCSVDTSLYRPSGQRHRWLLGYMGTYSADRQPAVEELLLKPARSLDRESFVLAGPQYPPSIEWPPNLDYLAHVAPREHADFYGALGFALNLTRRDMVVAGHSPSVRLFEAAACGVPIISDSWPGIELFFEPGADILLATSSEDVVGFLHLAEERRAAIGRRGQERVLADHTADQRALELEGFLEDAARKRKAA